MSRLDVSDALSESFRTVFRNLGTYFRTQGIVLLLVGLVGLAFELTFAYALQPLIAQATEEQGFELLLAQLPALLGGMVAMLAVLWILSTIALGLGIVATHRLLRGEDTTFGEAFERLRPRLGNLILTALLFTLAVVGVILAGFALFFLVIPVFAGIVLAIYLAARWATALPASVLEEHGVKENLTRAGDMTAGSRLPIFGAFALLILATMAVGVVVMLPVAIAEAALGIDTTDPTAAATMPMSVVVLSSALNLVVQFFSTFLTAALLVVVYRQLREPAAQPEPQAGAIGGGEVTDFDAPPPPGY